MPDPEPTLPSIALAEAASVLDPLTALDSAGEIVGLLEELGWDFPGTSFPATFSNIKSDLDAVFQKLDQLAAAQTEDELQEKAMELLGALTPLIAQVVQLANQMNTALGQYTAFRDGAKLVEDLPRRLLDYLLVTYLAVRQPRFFRLFQLLGLVGFKYTPVNAAQFRRETTIALVHWERFPLIFSDPAQIMQLEYGWGGDFESERFLARLAGLLVRLGFVAGPMEQNAALRAALGRAATEPEWRVAFLRDVQAPATGAGTVVEAGLQVSNLPPAGAAAEGLAVIPYLYGAAQTTTEEFAGLKISLAGSLKLDANLGLELRPPHELTVRNNLLGTPVVPSQAAFALTISKTGQAGAPLMLAGKPKKTRVTAASFDAKVAGEKDGTREEMLVETGVRDLTIAVVPSDGDGFLQKVLPPDGITCRFDVIVGWSSVKGLYFAGSAALEVTIPLHVSIAGVINLDSIWVRLAALPADRELEIVAAVNGGLKLGPIAASVERIGLRTILDFPQNQDGNLGAVDAKLAFKPPDGAGMKIGAGPVGGGGYIYFNEKEEQYAGVLQLDFKAFSFKAIGLLTTRFPDGTKGFSLLIIITAEFNPIQLGYGFTLNGLGGLLGLNRTIVVDVLRAGIKTGAVGSILFPKDPVARAPQLLSDLRTIFPPAPNRFVVGPMVKVGWGASLITLELGVLIELPPPIRIVILGRLSMVLPDKDAPVLSLNMDILGIIEFDRGEMSLDARIFDSRLVVFALTGEMAMRLGWGARPHFELSAGGFHPKFQPPAGFPSLERIALTLADSDNPRLRAETYFALTSNSLQMGARLDFHVHVDIAVVGLLSVDAYLGFDVLLRFIPFSLEADIGAAVTLKRNGKPIFAIDLALHVTGPGPWHIWGGATFEFFGKHTIPLDETIGDPAPPAALPESHPDQELAAAFADPINWSAQLPGDGRMLVTLREIKPGTGEILMHPFGDLTVRQRVLPLNVTIQKFGETRPIGPLRFEVTAASVGGEDATARAESVKEHFAPARFFELSDDEKLSRPGFEALEAGRRIASTRFDEPAGVETNFDYEDVLVDVEPNTGFKQRRGAPKTYRAPAAVAEALSHSGTVEPDQELGIALDEAVHVVASTLDLEQPEEPGATVAEGLTYTEALERMRDHEAEAPEDRGKLQVVGAHEAVV